MRMAYTIHVIRDQVSFGSQLQYDPHAIPAHKEPVMIPIVKKGKPYDIHR
jgi:hypothetical protein